VPIEREISGAVAERRTVPLKLRLNLGAEDAEELGEPGVERGPGRAGDEIAVNEGVGHGQTYVGAASESNVWTGGRVCTALLSPEDVRDGENLRGVADGGEGFVGFRKVMDDFDDAWVEAKVFGRAAARDDEGVIVFRLDVVEGGVESEIVAALLCIRLIAFEIVDAGGNDVAGFFTGTDSMDGVANHQKRLEGHHHFVVFDVITNEHENGFLGHVASRGIVTEEEVGPKRCKKVVNQFAGGTANLGCAACCEKSRASACEDLLLQKREYKKRAGRSVRATGSVEENGVSK
jgi:hypothetical protein